MKSQIFTEKEIVKAIQSGGLQREKVIRYLYNDRDLKNKVQYFVKNNSGNLQDGEDIFHEGIIVLDRNIRQDKYKEESSVQGYLYSICRFLWMNQIRKNSKVSLTDDTMQMDQTEHSTPEVQLFEEEQKTLLRDLIGNLGDRCRKILELWKLSYSMEEIANELGFSSAAMARKNKYRCHKSLLEIIKENPQLVNSLRN